jgi:hypothetical protein
MNPRPSLIRAASLACVTAALGTAGALRGQDLESPAGPAWYVRLGAVARFNVKASINALPPPSGTGLYDNGFVQPDIGGTASGLTWNWGYKTSPEYPTPIVGDQLLLHRTEGVPTLGHQDLNVSNPALGGEIIGGARLMEFVIGSKTARLAFELGYGYTPSSEHTSFTASGTATRTTDAYGLGGIVPPLPPYAGTFTGPGPLLDLNYSSREVVVSPATYTFQGSLQTTLHEFRVGPALEVDLSRRLTVAFGAGYSSILVEADLAYTESVAYGPAIPSLGPSGASIHKSLWRPGAYAEVRVNYQVTQHIGAFVGGDLHYNKDMTFGDATHEVQIGLGTTFGAKAGLTVQF